MHKMIIAAFLRYATFVYRSAICFAIFTLFNILVIVGPAFNHNSTAMFFVSILAALLNLAWCISLTRHILSEK